MIFSRHQINKLGDIVAFSNDESERQEAVKQIDEWRTSHLPVMEDLTERIVKDFHDNNITFALTSKRLKRLPSILVKLKANKNGEMKLGGLHDIVGQRFIFEDMDELMKAITFMENYNVEGYIKKGNRDYITTPKASGYRSYHVIFERDSDDPSLKGLKVEVQLRTKLQHSWAMAVETAGVIDKCSIKSGEGSDEWKDFFKIVSALFSIKEVAPLLEEYKGQSIDEIMKGFCHLSIEHKLVEKLANLNQFLLSREQYTEGYQVVTSDFKNEKVYIQSFGKDEKEKASEYYSEEEQKWSTAPVSVVMVSVSSMNELIESYPSYFNDTTEFVNAMRNYSFYCSRYLR